MDKVLSGRRILIVEDDTLLLMTIEDVLADLGCESVVSASTVDTAVSLVNGQVFDAAVLDMTLNGTSSRAVADALAARGVPSFGNLSSMTNWSRFLCGSCLADRVTVGRHRCSPVAELASKESTDPISLDAITFLFADVRHRESELTASSLAWLPWAERFTPSSA
jgi:CheY-like chemotaxis protein